MARPGWRGSGSWRPIPSTNAIASPERQRDRYAVREVYQRRSHRRQPYRNGYYERDFVTRLGTIRLRIARTRGKSFLPRALEPFQRRAEDVAMLIREAFLS